MLAPPLKKYQTFEHLQAAHVGSFAKGSRHVAAKSTTRSSDFLFQPKPAGYTLLFLNTSSFLAAQEHHQRWGMRIHYKRTRTAGRRRGHWRVAGCHTSTCVVRAGCKNGRRPFRQHAPCVRRHRVAPPQLPPGCSRCSREKLLSGVTMRRRRHGTGRTRARRALVCR